MNIKYLWQRCFLKIHGTALKNVVIHTTSKIEANSIVINTTMDKYSFCGYNCKIINAQIGSFCSIADGVVIGGAQHPITWASTSPVFYKGRDSIKKKFSEFDREAGKITIIGHDVWIGENVLIKAGVSIGTGAIIGMGAVVTKDILPYEIVGGVPAECIKQRFPQETINKLLGSRWWEKSDEDLLKCAHLIKTPELFLEEINQL